MKKYNEVKILTYYALSHGYISFPDNKLNNKVFKNVTIEIKNEEWGDEICIENENPIQCELVEKIENNGNLILKICQDWG